jgi:methylated-DNA-[protein]-cysteine S-methyltransferase
MSIERAIKSGRLTPAMSFSQKVWAICARLPRGKVATYGQIAARLGSRSGRAVGQALHRNPYAPAVPCHRVVGGDGSLTGYAGGLPKKRAMLKAEGVAFRGDKVALDRSRVSL